MWYSTSTPSPPDRLTFRGSTLVPRSENLTASCLPPGGRRRTVGQRVHPVVAGLSDSGVPERQRSTCWLTIVPLRRLPVRRGERWIDGRRLTLGKVLQKRDSRGRKSGTAAGALPAPRRVRGAPHLERRGADKGQASNRSDSGGLRVRGASQLSASDRTRLRGEEAGDARPAGQEGRHDSVRVRRTGSRSLPVVPRPQYQMPPTLLRVARSRRSSERAGTLGG
jgi:hypothetical protein